MNGAYSTTDARHLFKEQGVGGRGHFIEGLHVNVTGRVPIADPN